MAGTEPFTPKLVRMAEAAVVSMQVDGLLGPEDLRAWDAWRNGTPPQTGPDRKVAVPTETAGLFRSALAREARRLEAGIDRGDDADGDMGNDLALIRCLVPA